MSRSMKGMPSKLPASNKLNPGTIKRLFSYFGNHKLLLAIVAVCIIINAATGALAALFMQTLIDDHIAPLLLSSNPVFDGLLTAIMKMASILSVGLLAGLLYNRIMVRIAQGVIKKIRDDMFIHMQSLPIGYFDSHTHGDLMSHYTNDVDTLRQMITQSLPHVFSSLISILTVIFSMLYLSIWLTLIVFVFVFFVLRIVRKIAGKSSSYFIRQQRALGDVNGYIEEMINGLKVVKVFGHEKQVQKRFCEKNGDLREQATKANTFANILMPIMGNLGYLLYVILAIGGGVMVIAGLTNYSLTGVDVVSLGMIASFLQLSRNFINPIAQVSQQLNAVIMALAGAERIFELMDEKPEADDGRVTLVNARFDVDRIIESEDKTDVWAWKTVDKDGTINYTELKGEVVFSDVDFSYVPDKPVLHDISLYAKPGQKIAFVGSTGAGKTTITNLINRFYDIADGQIHYDGIDIKKIHKNDLRRSLGIVLQDVNLFTGTVMENIRYGNLQATDDECIAAAKLANADGFIRMLPQGYQTEIAGDGSDLSQGQRQLISIARAAVADPPVMILDEATSSIDTRTEAIVQRGMDALMHGRTVFVIAHRLSTIKNADVIMVLEDGRIIERGSHDELIQEKGRYYKLYTGVFELD